MQLEPQHHSFCDFFETPSKPCTCGLDALKARVAYLEGLLRAHFHIGDPDEWECAHGVKVSQRCPRKCHLNETRRALGFIK